MKITRLNLFLIIAVFLIFLTACGKESKTKSTSTQSTNQQENILKSLGLKNQNDIDTWETPLSVSVLQSSYLWASTLEGKILESDNTFVATVKDLTTEYSYPAYDDSGELISSIPTAHFKLKVLDNLRGELPINETVQASRVHFGYGDGVEEGQFITTIENDIIPEMGKTYIFLTRVIESALIILNGGDAPSNFPLENAPLDLDQQPKEVIQEIVDSSTKIREIEKQVENERVVFAKIGDTLLNGQEIQSRIEGQKKALDLEKVVVEE